MHATLFLDVQSAAVLAAVTETAQESFAGSYRLIHVGSATAAAAHDSLVEGWMAAGGPTMCMEHFVCYITEAGDITSSDVSYAVYVARLPTLSLRRCPDGLQDLVADSALLRTLDDDADDGPHEGEPAVRRVRRFLRRAPPQQGRVLVMEGGDGAGKETQTRLLVRRLAAEEAAGPVHTLDFPYEPGLYGGVIRLFLSGKRGGLHDLDPALFSFIFSLNRYGCLPQLSYWLQQEGATVVLDRYYTSNFGHQGAKLPPEERQAFIAGLEHLELRWLGLPAAALVAYLDLPPKVAFRAMMEDTSRAYLDIHETAGDGYKGQVRDTFRWCSAHLPRWLHVLCYTEEGERLSREAVHERIYQHVLALHEMRAM
ncbi:dTMP kinase [Strigomonas culicis]|uniref:dTMP kinase n=1 Tax=Strigomonas culicis TaxID=28005 RepID=S9UHV9_9TRYP|nr:dTMP kinase [Strigomonas culicis]|eukprot:EPY28508.1 dTMP kinase [Strigomonas culicis]